LLDFNQGSGGPDARDNLTTITINEQDNNTISQNVFDNLNLEEQESTILQSEQLTPSAASSSNPPTTASPPTGTVIIESLQSKEEKGIYLVSFPLISSPFN
jgi:hypothetical protein